MSAADLPVGAVLASALMAAKYGGDSGEDVDRLIDELAKRGAVVVTADTLAPAILAARATTADWKGNARATEPTRWDRLLARRAVATLSGRSSR